jgi:pyridoxamine 5'-phosphate oxidase
MKSKIISAHGKWMKRMSDTKRHIQDVRKDYQAGQLLESECPHDPFLQFEAWMKVAIEQDPHHANAMVLSTCGADQIPDGRVVLLRDLSYGGFTFFTNYLSKKARDLQERPYATLLFFWPLSERQVRITGRMEKLPEQCSRDYFASRPFESQVGAHASLQSTVVGSRKELDDRYDRQLEIYQQEKIVPCPAHWGGYVLLPSQIEFWQGRSSRLHDRLRYRQGEDNKWIIERLMP